MEAASFETPDEADRPGLGTPGVNKCLIPEWFDRLGIELATIVML